MKQTNDLHIRKIRPLISPLDLRQRLPMGEESNRTVVESREAVRKILEKKDRRFLVIVGPCSIHDPQAALEYAGNLKKLCASFGDKLFIVMRVYFEKPRTVMGWRGLITDPDMDGSYNIEKGLHVARKLLLDITSLGIPAGSEVLDPIVPQYLSELITWASIGARTTESQIHREMASGLSMPVGFKNSTDGSLDVAVNGLSSAAHEHSFIGIDQYGMTCVLNTSGNPHGHIILRGGREGPNYHAEDIDRAEAILAKAGLEPRILIDCSHGNSGKKCARQEVVLKSVTEEKKKGRGSLIGVMLESSLIEGNQCIDDPSDLKYGVSVTDECIGWEKTEELLAFMHKEL